MLCQKCQQNKATVFFHYQVNNQATNVGLCQQCYIQEQQKFQSQFGSPFKNLFGGGGQPFDDLFQMFNNSANQQGQQGSHAKVKTHKQRGNSFLDQFGINLTDQARSGKIDPVIGRDKEIQKVIEILNRRNKNNPVLIGEPGVGKTAIAEGLALKVISGDVPYKLRDKQIYELDVASLVANTGIRGQFEQRMKQLIKELQEREDVILFIDELHLIVGAGSAEGSMDASNILKPALARGDIQIIGATTLQEYRKIEKDGALERRFQPVIVHEPSVEDTIKILHGLKDRYEEFHQVQYTEEAIRASVVLSQRYIQDRFLPDKAIDLLDEAGSKVNLATTTMPKHVIEERLRQITREKQEALQHENYELAAKLRDEEKTLIQLKETSDDSTEPVVTEEIIQQIIEEKTDIPVTKLQKEEQEQLKNLEKNLQAKVIGQDEAVRAVAKAIRRSRAGLKPKNRPIGTFLFVGPTGVGKTELSKRLAEELFGTQDAMIRLDMSEYMEKHSVSKLIGSPPGYVGYEEAGQLTEQVRRNPYSLILLDEVEKAHPDVMHLFLQILEDGRLTDSQGRTVSFKDTVIIMTSNAGTGDKQIRVGFDQDKVPEKTDILERLKDYFKPEFLNRFDSVIQFNPLSKEDLLKIVDIMIAELNDQLKEVNKSITVSAEVKEKIVELGWNPAFGARPLRRTIQEQLEDQIADFVLDFPDVSELQAFVDAGEIIIAQK